MSNAPDTLNFPKELAHEITFLLPGTDGTGLGAVADETLYALHQKGFVAGVGLTREHARSAYAIGLQPHVLEWCPNDSETRFADDKVESWQGKNGGRGFVGIYDVIGNEGAPLSIADVTGLSTDDVDMGADGWAGYEKNDHIPGADITTAYRVSAGGIRLARARRADGEQFGLGSPLGVLVPATAIKLYGANPYDISLETWQKNEKAVGLYGRLGFDFITKAKSPEPRPTLMPLGTQVGKNIVYVCQEGKLAGKNVIDDTRLFFRLGRQAAMDLAA